MVERAVAVWVECLGLIEIRLKEAGGIFLACQRNTLQIVCKMNSPPTTTVSRSRGTRKGINRLNENVSTSTSMSMYAAKRVPAFLLTRSTLCLPSFPCLSFSASLCLGLCQISRGGGQCTTTTTPPHVESYYQHETGNNHL